MTLVEAATVLDTLFLTPLQTARTALLAVQGQSTLAQKIRIAPRMGAQMNQAIGDVEALIEDVQNAIQALVVLRQEPVPQVPAP